MGVPFLMLTYWKYQCGLMRPSTALANIQILHVLDSKALLSYVKKRRRSSAIKILNPRPRIKNDERRLLTDIFSPEDDL